MARLVRTLRVRRGAPCRRRTGLTQQDWPASSRLVRTRHVRRGAPRLKARTLADMRPLPVRRNAPGLAKISAVADELSIPLA